METRIMDMSDPEQVVEVLTGYYNLFSEDLRCIQQKNTPEEDHLKRDRVIVVAAYDDASVLAGLLTVDNDYVLFPVLSGDYVECLTALILKAYEANGNYLRAQTKNELILDTAVSMGIGVTRSGFTLEFK